MNLLYISSDNHYYEKFDDGTIKDITDEIPFEIPNSWCWTRLKNICTLSFSGKSPKYSKIINNNLVLGQKNNQDYGIDLNSIKYCTNEFLKDYSDELYLKKNDVLLNTLGGGTVGRSGIFNLEDNKYITDGHLFVFRTINEAISYYLLYYLKLNRTTIERNADGSTNQIFLKLDNVKKYLVPLPPLEEQSRIKNKIEILNPIINLYDSKYNEIEALNTSYKEELKKSILQYAIQGKLVKQDPNDESAEVLINKILEEKRELIKTKQIKKENLSIIYKDADNQFYEKFDDGKIVNITDEIPFDIPINWSWTRLYNVLEIARGGSPRPIQAFLTEADEGINWIKIGDTEKGGKYINSTKEKIIPEEMKKSRFVKKGDFILSNSMSFGRPYILNIDGCIHDGWLVFSNVGTCFFKDYLYYLLSSNFVYSQFCSRVSGAVVNNLNSDKVKSTLIPLPPKREQKRIASSLEYLFNILADT